MRYKKFTFSTVFIIGLAFLHSCIPTKPLVSSIATERAKEILVFEPFTDIQYIGKNNKPRYDEGLSMEVSQKLLAALDSFPEVPISVKYKINDINLYNTLSTEAVSIYKTAAGRKSVNHVPITPAVDSILQSQGMRFGMIIISTGFSRTKQNIRKELGRGIALGFATAGMVFTSPILGNTSVHIFIVDAQSNKAIFYNHSTYNDTDPLKKDIQLRHIEDIFTNYYW